MSRASPGEDVDEASSASANLGDTTTRNVSIGDQRTEEIVEEFCRAEESFTVGIGGPLLAEIGNRSCLQMLSHFPAPTSTSHPAGDTRGQRAPRIATCLRRSRDAVKDIREWRQRP